MRTVAILLCLLTAGRVSGEAIHVAAAVSLKQAMTEIAARYEAQTGNHVDLTFGSSGQLMAQIRSGAPVDVFISAAGKQVDELDRAGMVDRASRRIIAGNALVLIIPVNALSGVTKFEDLANPTIGKVAIGEPGTVPAGEYASQVLRKLNLEQALDGRVIYGSNVRQVLDYVQREEVSAGIVYATDAKEAGAKVKLVATAKANTHEPIQYPAVALKASSHHDASINFLQFLCSDIARSALTSRGFTTLDGQRCDAKQ